MTNDTVSATNARAPMSRSRAWVVAIRPATLPAAIGPVLVGLAVAISLGVFEPLPAVAALAVALLLQIASNVGNDLSDFRSGVDTDERLGPPRAAAQGLLNQREMLAGLGLIVGLAGLVGLYLVSVGGLVILVLGVAAVISAFAYSGGPWPYGYHGLGEVFVFVFFGLVAVAGTTYLQTLTWEPLAFAAAVPVGALITSVLVVNNLRDIDTDARTGKRTLAVMLGERGAMAEYDVLLGLAYAMPVVLVIAGDVSIAALLPLATAPMAVALFRVVHADGDPRRLNPVLRMSARLSLLFSALFAIGLAVPELF
jgi:1,4-dihydroxy-2-naphthoate octaprenyltransferase